MTIINISAAISLYSFRSGGENAHSKEAKSNEYPPKNLDNLGLMGYSFY